MFLRKVFACYDFRHLKFPLSAALWLWLPLGSSIAFHNKIQLWKNCVFLNFQTLRHLCFKSGQTNVGSLGKKNVAESSLATEIWMWLNLTECVCVSWCLCNFASMFIHHCYWHPKMKRIHAGLDSATSPKLWPARRRNSNARKQIETKYKKYE